MDSPELARAIGKIEGGQDAMKERLDGFAEVLDRIEADLHEIKAAEAKRKGERGVLLWIVGLIAGGASAAITAGISKFFS